MKQETRLILVGGFLGAGKTTLLSEITGRLMTAGKKVGLITNDQAAELVDTAFLLKTTQNVAEVSGSCFCCNFNGFINSIRKVGEQSDADILIAEPVGSCTDLSSTLVQPLKKLYANELLLSPLTVLADPLKLEDILNGGNAGLHKSAAYIYRKQLEESDVVLVTKTDTIEKARLEFLKEKLKTIYPHTKVMAISSKTGEGVDKWLKYVLNHSNTKHKSIEVDYKIYAEGEAVLGWLNTSIFLRGNQINWDEFATRFLSEISQQVKNMNLSVGHIKIILQNGANYLVGNIVNDLGTIEIRGKGDVSDQAQMIINARVELPPDQLETIVDESLGYAVSDRIEMEIIARKCISPGYPNPTYRFTRIL